MKKSFLFVLMMFCCASFVYGLSQDYEIPISCYDFENNSQDSIGNNDATITNGAYSLGMNGLALDMTGSSTIFDTNILTSTELGKSATIMLWFNNDKIANPNQDFIIEGFKSGDLARWDVSIYKDLTLLYRPVTVGDFRGSRVLGLNTWHHIAFTYDNTTNNGSVFLNGTLEISRGDVTNGINTNTPTTIEVGVEDNAGTRTDGQLDVYVIWNKTLSPSDIQEIYENRYSCYDLVNIFNDTTNPAINSITISDTTPKEWDTIYVNVSATDNIRVDYILLYDNRTGTFSQIGNYSCSSANCKAEFSTTAQEGTIQFKAKAVDTSGNFVDSSNLTIVNLNLNAIFKFNLYNETWDNASKFNGVSSGSFFEKGAHCRSLDSGCFYSDDSTNPRIEFNPLGKPAEALLNPVSDLTFSCHINPVDRNNEDLFLFTRDTSVATGITIDFLTSVNNVMEFIIYQSDGERWVSTLTPNYGSWQHVAFVYNSSNNRIYKYLNGTLLGTTDPISMSSSSVGSTFYLGSHKTNDNYKYKGAFQGCYFFNRTLSQEEIGYLNENVILKDDTGPFNTLYTATAYCQDSDGDGYGVTYSTACQYPELDCDDNDANVHPPRNGATYTSPKTFCEGVYNLSNGMEFIYTINFKGDGIVSIT